MKYIYNILTECLLRLKWKEPRADIQFVDFSDKTGRRKLQNMTVATAASRPSQYR
jgi:hypothetical protein